MKARKFIYVVHRWLGIVVSLQLLAWSVSGLVFSLLAIDDVRGERDRRQQPPPAIDTAALQVMPTDAIAEFAAVSDAAVAEIKLSQSFDGRLVYTLYDASAQPLAVVDAANGDVATKISSREAEAAALRDFAHEATVTSVDYYDADAPLEYRGKPLPAYRVVLDHPKQPHIYVSSITGEVTSRRNARWRVFDFFWMLHIMDYGDRENFNHWLLSAMSALAIFTAASGLVLWGFRIGRKPRRNVRTAGRAPANAVS